MLRCGLLQKLGPCSVTPIFSLFGLWHFRLRFCTPIVRSNCPLKSIESAKFYENGFSPALPFMITLWPHDKRLCCIDFNTNNCWLRTEKNIQVQRKVKQLQSLIEKSESGVGWNACFANILLALKSICGNFPTVLCLRLSVYARLVSVLWLVFAAPPIKVTTGQ